MNRGSTPRHEREHIIFSIISLASRAMVAYPCSLSGIVPEDNLLKVEHEGLSFSIGEILKSYIKNDYLTIKIFMLKGVNLSTILVTASISWKNHIALQKIK
jgi:hypothetical protein